MKIFNTRSKRWLASISAVCMLSVSLTSCLKDHTNDYSQTPVAYLSVTQASIDAPSGNLFISDNQVNTTPFTYGSILGYVTAYTGKRTVYLKDASSNTLAQDTITLVQNTPYSMYIANSISHPDFIVLKDTLNVPAAGNANVRFINVSTDAGPVDLAVTGGSVITANKAYKGFSSFAPMSGDKLYNLEVRQAGTSTVLATAKNIAINSGFVYTIWLHGSVTGSATTKLAIDVFNNAH